ncbi:hypothetical protein FN846DRAFT_1013674 [Sphaerosporella brunnea]|uniref:Uncharacterized protein n=1 Tax=Sphaerosporella brunnea TaxID=1250544 RepID=A0A5J5EXK5_9PEZI|nr:hypothetical protein FN846DRAFT_1013674 [Sphaerosporella brunnea]
MPPTKSPPPSRFMAVVSTLSTFFGCALLWVLAIPFVTIYVVVQLLASLLELPRFIHRWLLHPSTVLEAEYHSPQAYALITGASQGIGRAIAEELARREWNLILHGRNPDKLDTLAELLRSRHPNIDIRVTVQDTSHPTSFPHLFAHNLINIVGPITLLINNVANQHSSVPFCRLTEDDISNSLATNIAFPTLLTNHLLSHPIQRRPSQTGFFPPMPDESTSLLAAKNDGVQWELRCIINMSCIAGLHATENSSVHAATKAYLTQLSRGIIADAPAKIEVLNLLIGHTRTSSWRGKNSMLVQDVRACVRNCLSAVGLGKTTGRNRAWWCYDLLGLGANGGRGEGVYVSPIQELWVGMERLFPSRVSSFMTEYYDSLFARDDTI